MSLSMRRSGAFHEPPFTCGFVLSFCSRLTEFMIIVLNELTRLMSVSVSI